MTEKKQTTKEIHVDKLIVHAKEVEIIHERKRPFNPWFFGPPRVLRESAEEENFDSSKEHEHDQKDQFESERRKPFWM